MGRDEVALSEVALSEAVCYAMDYVEFWKAASQHLMQVYENTQK
jgi:hypothetical protein